MAKKSMILKQQAPAKFSTRRYNRCKICGRPRRSQGFLLIFFRYTSLKLLGVHKVRRRRFASSDEKISRRTCC